MPKSTFTDLSYSNFRSQLQSTLHFIQEYLGEPQNPDDMLAEGQALLELLNQTYSDTCDAERYAIGLDNVEDHAFEDLATALSKAKKFVGVFASSKWLATLDIPARMPRSREKVREAARAALSAWDVHSADPELARVIPAMTELRTAFDAFVTAWDAQQDANRIKKEKYRAAKEARAKCDKFVSRVKKYLSLFLDPYDVKWGLYGFEEREKGN